MSDVLLLRALKTLESKMKEINDLLREQRDDYQETYEALTQDNNGPDSD